MTPKELTQHLEAHAFQSAKTSAAHAYTLRKNWGDDKLFDEVVQAIRDLGEQRKKGKCRYIYFDANGWTYWTMGAALSDTILINRAQIKGTANQETPEPEELPEDPVSGVTGEAVAQQEASVPEPTEPDDSVDDGMHIIRFKAQNFKKLIAVDIERTGNVMRITGKNGMGKTCVMDGICSTLCGNTVAPQKPIREGETRAETIVETEGLIVKRVYTASGSRLEVTNKEGLVFKSPQKMLDELVGDPEAFMDKSDKERRQILIDLMGVDVSAHDQKIADLKSERSTLLAQKQEASRELEDMPQWLDAPAEEVSLTELMAELKLANETNKAFEALQKRADEDLKELTRLNDELQKLKAQIATAEQAAQTSQESMKDKAKVDTEAIEQRAEQLELTNKQVRENAARAQKEATTEELGTKVYEKFQAIQAAEDDKTNALANVTLPMEGLSVDADGVTYEGIPWRDVNHAKQFEISMAIRIAQQRKAKVLLVNGNGLDSDTYARVVKMAKDNHFDIWMEVMDESGKMGIVIEEGEVVSIN